MELKKNSKSGNNQSIELNQGNGSSESSDTSEGAETGAAHAEGGGHSEEGGEGESGDPSSPILQLDEGWDGIVNGIRINMQYDQAKGRFYGIVENTTNKVINNILIELNLKLGTKTVVELGPEPVGNLQPGQKANVELLISEEPEAKGVKFDAWEIHPEAEGQGTESGEAGEEGTSTGAMTLAQNETYDVTKNGARLILKYNAGEKAFKGTLENAGNQILTRARVEIHLDNGTELGPTTPVDLPVGKIINLSLPVNENFDTWVTHAEFGIGENGESSEHGTSSEGSDGGSGESSESYNESSEGGSGESSESHNEGSEGGND